MKPREFVASNPSSEETEAYLLLGSNVGDRIGYLRKSVDSLSAFSQHRDIGLSSIYETEPVGYTDQPKFLNVAAVVPTSIEARELLIGLKNIESRVGRVPRKRWREREIDIDIIFYGGSEIESDDLVIPHPMAHKRRFVLKPLCEIAPEFMHPLLHKTVRQLLDECEDRSGVMRFDDSSVLRG